MNNFGGVLRRDARRLTHSVRRGGRNGWAAGAESFRHGGRDLVGLHRLLPRIVIDASRQLNQMLSGRWEIEKLTQNRNIYAYDGRGGGIRTPDPLLPKQVKRLIEAC